MMQAPCQCAPRREAGGGRSFILILAAAVWLAACGADSGGMPAPQVKFVSIKGEEVLTSELRGRVALINFWATDCVTCVREMPQIVATYEKYRARGFETIAVAMRHDPPNYVIAFAERHKLPFKVALDPMGELAKAFGDVKLTPMTFVIDRRGRIAARILGEPDFAQLHRLIEEKLEET
jgi:peroxiredoxin